MFIRGNCHSTWLQAFSTTPNRNPSSAAVPLCSSHPSQLLVTTSWLPPTLEVAYTESYTMWPLMSASPHSARGFPGSQHHDLGSLCSLRPASFRSPFPPCHLLAHKSRVRFQSCLPCPEHGSSLSSPPHCLHLACRLCRCLLAPSCFPWTLPLSTLAGWGPPSVW